MGLKLVQQLTHVQKVCGCGLKLSKLTIVDMSNNASLLTPKD